MWNYKPKASSLEAELKSNFDADCELIAGSSGVFDVEVEGTLIYSKAKTGKFPDTDEVSNLIKKSGQCE